jgi:NAD(P)-dependent dehydrogenase (short-subunit alcohol dehydrogenase family)
LGAGNGEAGRGGSAMTNERKVALVTGASRGIGKAVCLHLALEGYDIVATARSVQEQDTVPYPGTITETAARVRELGREALALRCDLTDLAEVQSVYERTIDRFGRVDVLVNNARYEGPAHWGWFTETPWAEIEELLRVNLHAPLFLSQLALPAMIAQGGGTIFNIASRSAQTEIPTLPGAGSTGLFYPTSKAGVNRFAVGLTKELRAKEAGVAIVNVSPGPTLTERATVDTAGQRGYDYSRRLSVHIIARTIAWLATCPDPTRFSGHVIEAPDFVREYFLMTAEELMSPWVPGEVYDPYREPAWERRLRERGR